MRDYIFRAAMAVLSFGAIAAPASADHNGGAVAYKDPGFRGPAITINGPVHNLALERFNDTISSIELDGAWEVCVDPNFRGKCTVIDGSVARLADFRMNDNITSMRPVNGRRGDRSGRRGRDNGRYGNNRGRDGALTLYKDPGYRGQATAVNYAIPNLKDIRFNDTISSIRVNRGRWLVCEHPNYRGRCEVIDASIGSLSIIRLNDRITSIRPYDGRKNWRDRGNRRNVGYNGGSRDYRDHDWNRDGSNGYGRTRQFDDPRDEYGDRIRARQGNAERYCRSQDYNRVVEVETSGRYLGCIICSK